jgi:hypothetical protein
VNWNSRTYKEGGQNRDKAEKLGDAYHDTRWGRHAALIARKKAVIVQRDKVANGVRTAARDGYIAILFVDNVKFEGDVLTFDF